MNDLIAMVFNPWKAKTEINQSPVGTTDLESFEIGHPYGTGWEDFSYGPQVETCGYYICCADGTWCNG